MPISLNFTLLNPDLHPLADITPLVLSGSLVFNNTSGRTRTATLDLRLSGCDEGDKHMDKSAIKGLPHLFRGEGVTAGSEWHAGGMPEPACDRAAARTPQGWRGALDLPAEEVLIRIENSSSPLALLLPTSATTKQTSSGTVLSLRLSDKYAILDGTLGGILDTDVLVPSGSIIPTVISSLLSQYDPLPPVFSANRSAPVTPCDIRIPAGKPVSTLIEELSDYMSCTCSYDPSGRLVFRHSDALADDTPIKLSDYQIISKTSTLDYSSLVNDVLVLGATVNNKTFLGRAENNDPTTQTCISRVGRRTRVISMPDYRSDEICASYARRILRDCLSLTASETYVISPEAFSSLDPSALSGYTLSFNPTLPPEIYYS